MDREPPHKTRYPESAKKVGDKLELTGTGKGFLNKTLIVGTKTNNK